MRHVGLALLIVLLSTTSAISNSFQQSDSTTIDAMWGKVRTAVSDNLDIQRSLLQRRAINETDCLRDIGDQLDRLDSDIKEVSVLIGISVLMANSYDENIVNQYLSISLDAATKHAAISRQGINRVAGQCSSSAIIAARAQFALGLFGEAERILVGFKRRDIGAR